MAVKISHVALKDFCISVLVAIGVPSEDSKTVADVLVRADLRGVHSHGVAMLPVYIKRIKANEISKIADIWVEKETPNTTLFNGGNGLGQVISVAAMDLAIKKALDIGGISMVGVRGSNHFGMSAYYALRAVHNNMIGIVLTVSNINTMSLWGGLSVILGNNPIAVAVPAKDNFPIVYDGAFSVAARRKIHLAKQEKLNIPEGWAIDKEGIPTTDPQKALDGLLLPIGSYKGSGMAFVFGLIAGPLMGARFGSSVSNTDVGHAFIAINISAFCDPEIFKESVSAVIKEIKLSRKMPGIEKIFIPGERSFFNERKYTNEGIPLSKATVLALRELGNEFGIEFFS